MTMTPKMIASLIIASTVLLNVLLQFIGWPQTLTCNLAQAISKAQLAAVATFNK